MVAFLEDNGAVSQKIDVVGGFEELVMFQDLEPEIPRYFYSNYK